MVKNYKCPGCGATVEYDPQSGKMHCVYCNCDYEPSEIGFSDASDEVTEVSREEINIARKYPTFEARVAVCNSCGAELNVNGVEASSFCPYCGNASVVMDRVEQQLVPDHVIPFEVTREEAESLLRERLNEGWFIPDSIKNFELERLQGIYVPYWLYDTYYGAEQIWDQGKAGHVYAVGDAHYRNVYLDASRDLEDDSSKQLEPFMTGSMRAFNAAYMSGFYSDRFDVGAQEAKRVLTPRVKEMYNDAMRNKIQGGSLLQKPTWERTEMKVLSLEYALFPVWFLTFRHEDKPYTILVNGQTKKMAGAVPVNKTKAVIAFSLLTLLFSSILEAFIGLIFWNISKDKAFFTERGYFALLWFYLFWICLLAYLLILAMRKYKTMKKRVDLTHSGKHDRLAKERQERV